jgi:hypothetical protein
MKNTKKSNFSEISATPLRSAPNFFEGTAPPLRSTYFCENRSTAPLRSDKNLADFEPCSPLNYLAFLS